MGTSNGFVFANSITSTVNLNKNKGYTQHKSRLDCSLLRKTARNNEEMLLNKTTYELYLGWSNQGG
jgi:hypothetical protein